jgi:hypothetical protein
MANCTGSFHAAFTARATRLRPGGRRTHDGGHDRPTPAAMTPRAYG